MVRLALANSGHRDTLLIVRDTYPSSVRAIRTQYQYQICAFCGVVLCPWAILLAS